jgi:hypothetical protein
VPVEFVAGSRLLRVFEFAQVLGLAVGKSVGVGELLALPALGLLTGRSKIHKFSHSTLWTVTGYVLHEPEVIPCIAAKYADTLAGDPSAGNFCGRLHKIAPVVFVELV